MMIETIDETIDQIERLYHSVTGHEAPVPTETPHAAIPPEKDPEAHVEEQIDRLLDSLTRVSSGRPVLPSGWAPPVSVLHGSEESLVVVDLPGVTRESLRVRGLKGILEVSGARTIPESKERLTLRYAEQPFGAFHRVIPIPTDVTLDQLQAQFRDGVLTVRIPRISRSADAKDIVVS